jgi:hypothetical protein
MIFSQKNSEFVTEYSFYNSSLHTHEGKWIPRMSKIQRNQTCKKWIRDCDREEPEQVRGTEEGHVKKEKERRHEKHFVSCE